MRRIYYLGHYDTLDNKDENRHYELAASTKMSYILSAMEANGESVEVISPCTTRNNRFYKGKVVPIGKNSRLKLFSTWPYNPRVLRVAGRQLGKIKLFLYIFLKIKKTDTLIAYHALGLMRRLKWLKKLKKFRLLMEVEELYGDVMNRPSVSEAEKKFMQIADGYLFPAKQLNDKLNQNNKPYVLIHGTYQEEKDYGVHFTEPALCNKIHCVYAGTFDPRKGGAIMAANAARYLPENYHLHILGFGKKEDIDNMDELVASLSKSCSCTISYDGCLKGEEYLRFLQKCQIGLSTQNPNAAFNDTSFPSKILSYMANGLQVVTVRIPVVEDSAVHKWMHYYDEPTPEAIAKAILSVNNASEDGDGRKCIAELNRAFTKELKDFL